MIGEQWPLIADGATHMKVGLVYPSGSRRTTYSSSIPELRRFFDSNPHLPVFFLPSLSLLTLAACTPADVEIRLLDERIAPLDFDEPFDVVGITLMTEQAVRGYQIARTFRDRGVFTVLGGIHATTLSHEAARHADCVVIGEAESTWPALLDDFRRGSARPLYGAAHPVRLERSPVPRYDLLPPGAYPLMPAQTTRGCPHDCSFCTVTKVFGPRYRTKTVAQVVREVEAVQAASRTRRVVFNDDNMFVNRRKTRELLRALIPLRIRYFAQSDISIADDPELLELMQRSGCVTVFIGFESLVPENLASLQDAGWKRSRLATYSGACKRIQSHGIQVLGAFILGFDHDDSAVFERLIDFTLKNDILGQYHFLTPFPATRVRDELVAQGRLAAHDDRWDLYSCFDLVFEPRGLSRAELETGLLGVYQAVYADAAHAKRSRRMIEYLKRRSG